MASAPPLIPSLFPPSLLVSGVLMRIGVPHAFTTRNGGVSSGLFASLNFGNPGDLPAAERDPLVNIAENFQRVTGQIGTGGRELVQVHQVHGAAVHVVRAGRAAHEGAHDTKADAVVTNDAARVVAIRVADCAPVLIASADGRVVSAVHAGWRGVIAGVAQRTVEVMRTEFGVSHLVAAIGPCIGFDAFEVGPEVLVAFRRVFGAGTRVCRDEVGGKGRVDLKGALAEQLRGSGVEEIEVLPQCTVSIPEMFFSHRRDHGRTGRMAALIAPRSAIA